MLKKLLTTFLILGLIAAGVAYWGYGQIFNSNTSFEEKEFVFSVGSDEGYGSVFSKIQHAGFLKDPLSFDRVAGWMNYKLDKVPAGKYVIKKGQSNREIVGMFRSGNQQPVKVTFNNVRSLDQLAGELATNLEVDSVTLAKYLNDPVVMQEHGYTPETFMTMFVPNTYNLFWNISPEKLVSRMMSEHKKFWDKGDRRKKAEALSMTPTEIYTLASIVEKESQHGPERPTIAGLYLNRLKRGQALQADPTVVYATGLFGLRRVLNKHLEYDSPYNTYKYAGLPPGPIYMPSIQSIDAVLDHEKHSYLYMCAKPGFGTQHAFAKTLRGHNENANRYRKWLNQQGIR